MFPNARRFSRWAGTGSATAAILLLGLAPALAQSPPEDTKAVKGRIDFSAAELPAATVELELNREILGDMCGLFDAAIAGVLQSLVESNQANASEVTELAAERLAAGRELFLLAKDVVHEVRVRAYDGNLGDELAKTDISSKFAKQLTDEKWDKVLKFRDGGESVQVAVKRVEGSVLGIFIVASEGNDLVLVNVVCDASPEKIKKLTAAATKIGLENGLREVLERELRHFIR